MTGIEQLYLKPLSAQSPTIIPKDKLTTVGRSESCDITVDNKFLSFVHASVKLVDGGIEVSDLDSTNGIYKNEKRESSFVAKLGEIVSFASVKYEIDITNNEDLKKFDKEQTAAILRRASTLRTLSGSTAPPVPVGQESAEASEQQAILKLFPDLEFSEFIFEEKVGEKTFKFPNKKAIEMSVLFGNFIYKVDYFLKEDKNWILSTDPEVKEDKVFFPEVLNIKERKFLFSKGKEFYLLNNFDTIDLFKDGAVVKFDGSDEDESILIDGDSFIRAKLGRANFYFKEVDAPPVVVSHNRFLADKLLALLLLSFIFFWGLFSVIVVDLKPEKKKTTAIVVDRILYIKKNLPTTTLPSPPTTLVVKKKEVESIIDETIVEKSREEVESSQKRTSVVEVVARNEVIQKTKASSSTQNLVNKKSPEPAAPKTTSEVIKVSKASRVEKDYKSKISSLKNKYSKYLKTDQSSLSDLSSKNKKSSSLVTSQFGKKSDDKKSAATYLKAQARGIKPVGKDVGRVGEAHKISSKGFSKVASIGSLVSSRSVVVGSLDPKLIQNLLKENMPRFRYCYERELERTGKRFATTVVAKFTIIKGGASRNISVVSKNFTFTSKGTRCFKKVISTIRFPSPKGGGIVGITQPFTMEPTF